MFYVYKMHAGLVGTDECWVETEKLTDIDEWERAVDHAMSYGNEQDEYEEFAESEPECWLEAEVTTVEELEPYMGDILCGDMTQEKYIEELLA